MRLKQLQEQIGGEPLPPYEVIDRAGKDDMFLAPHIMSLDDDDLIVGGYESLAAREVEGISRLEELRQLAIRAGEPEERAKDLGFSARLFTFTGSDESVDRYGCRVLVDGTFRGKQYGEGWMLTDYKRAPRFMPFHEYSTIPVGRSLDTWKETKGARKRLRFAILMDEGPAAGGASDLAPKLTAAYKSRLMDSVSVGWWPTAIYRPTEEEAKKWGLSGRGVLFATNELWELSAVSIPGNPNARLENGVSGELIRSYERLADELGESSPELALQIRSALAPKTTIVDLGAKRDEPTEPEENAAKTCPKCGSTKKKCAGCGYSYDGGSGTDAPSDNERAVGALLDQFRTLMGQLKTVLTEHEEIMEEHRATRAPSSSVFERIIREIDQVTETARTITKQKE